MSRLALEQKQSLIGVVIAIKRFWLAPAQHDNKNADLIMAALNNFDETFWPDAPLPTDDPNDIYHDPNNPTGATGATGA